MKIATSASARETPDYDAAQISESMFFVVVCHRKEIDPGTAIRATCFPSGTSNGWMFVERDRLPESWWAGNGAYDGRDTPYPQPCAHHPETHVHSVGEC